MKTILRTQNLVEMNAVQSVLESHGIRTFLFSPSEGSAFALGYNSNELSCPELRINDEDEERAIFLIRASFKTEKKEAPAKPAARRCPKCGSFDTKSNFNYFKFLWDAPERMYSGKDREYYKCNNCDNKWNVVS